MNIRFLETFVWLCRLKNFNAVAEKLHTTQPSVSQRIGTLEDLFKQKLYVRGGKQFELTPAGRHLLSYAERIVDLSNEMQRELVIDEDTNAVVRVGIIELVTLSWLPILVGRIRDQETTATIDFTTETSQALIEMLQKDELDLVFVWGPINEPNVNNVPICTYPMAWLANPKQFDCDNSIDIVELAKLPVIMSRPGTSGYPIIKDYFSSYGIQNVPESPRPVSLNCSYSLATATQLVREGLGVMALPPFLMADEIAAAKVKVLPVTQPLPPIHLTACAKSSAGKAVINRIIELSAASARDYVKRSDNEFCKA